MITLDNISLPNMVWIDEYDWSHIQEAVGYSVSGALVINTGSRIKGRPITLGGEHAWLPRGVINNLIALAEQNKTMSLSIGTQSYQVRFCYDKPIEAKPLVETTPDTESDDALYQVTLRLREV